MAGVKIFKNKEEGKDGKTYWNETGFKLLIGEWEGKTTYTLFDARTGQKWSGFDPYVKGDNDGGDGEKSKW